METETNSKPERVSVVKTIKDKQSKAPISQDSKALVGAKVEEINGMTVFTY